MILAAIDSYLKNIRERDLVCYSVKANSNLAILKIMAEKGMGFDVVSGGELFKVLKIGADPQKIIYSGVGKTKSELEYAVDNDIKSINIVSQNSLLEKGSGQPLVATFSKRANGSSTLTPCALLSMTTVAGNNLMSGDFVAIPKSGTLAFSKGEQLLVSLQLTNRLPAGVKNYYVTVVFQLDQSNLD